MAHYLITLKGLLKRNLIHAALAFLLGWACYWASLYLSLFGIFGLYGAMLLLAVYEISNYHENWQWWLKSVFDWLVWATVMQEVYWWLI